MELEIRVLSAEEAERNLGNLANVLIDAVESGASVNFLLPLPFSTAEAFWKRVITQISQKECVLLAAFLSGQLVGTAQLVFPWMPNQQHRADVCKVLVHRSARRNGIARKLMVNIEEQAKIHNKQLLVLDTVHTSPAENLYRSMGYTCAGIIPRYAMNTSGILESTALFYKEIQRPHT